jgi:hypothetical protein
MLSQNDRVGRCCSQTTVKGEPCQSYALAGSDQCASHVRRVGVKPKLTTEVADKIVALVGRGVPISFAAAAVDVSRASLYRWLRRPEPLFRSFAERVEQARANGEAALVVAIRGQAATMWRSAAWLLEREYPERYGRPGDRPAAASEPRPPDPFGA